MIFKQIKIKEGIMERSFDFSKGSNLIFSKENGCGKTTLLRFILYSLGYNIPNTKNIKFDKCEVQTLIMCDNGEEMMLSRYSHDAVTITINGKSKTYTLPDQLQSILEILFCTDSSDILNNVLGAIYADQEKGWTLLNRGKVIGSIRFNIEELIRGLSKCDCKDLIQLEGRLNKEISKYKQMFSIAQYREEIVAQSGTVTSDTYFEECATKKNQLLMREKSLRNELNRIDKNLSDNRGVKKFISDMKLLVDVDGKIIQLTADRIVGLNDTIEFLICKRKIIASELATVMRQLSELQAEQENEEEQLSFFQSESMERIFDKRIASIPMDMASIDKKIKELEDTRKSVRNEINSKTKADTGTLMSLYNNVVKYAAELEVENSESIAESYLFTSNLKVLSGAVLHKTVFAFRLAYICELEKKLGIKLPIILDSPRGKEIDQINTDLMIKILNRDFKENQIIIAFIYKYDLNNANLIELNERLLQP